MKLIFIWFHIKVQIKTLYILIIKFLYNAALIGVKTVLYESEYKAQN